MTMQITLSVLVAWCGLSASSAFAKTSQPVLPPSSPKTASADVASIQRGQDYIENTSKRLPQFTSSHLNCTHCHQNLGNKDGAASWRGVTHRFPQYRDRSGKVDQLTDRINDCFERSLNGKPLPHNHPAMLDILAYMKSLSPHKLSPDENNKVKIQKLYVARPANIESGQRLYMQKCSACHQPNGQGLMINDRSHFPPLWGEHSFNIGAGMARMETAAGFIKHNMPQGQENQLSDDEAWDITGFIEAQQRPDFLKKLNDWPKGNKPRDARY